MAHLLRMPEVAANAIEAVLADWTVAEHADFAAADVIATVETEKAVVDVEAEAAGVVLKTLVPPGAQVKVGSPIAVLGNPGSGSTTLTRCSRSGGRCRDRAGDARAPGGARPRGRHCRDR